MYMALKHIHMLCAMISFLGFLVRATWAFQGSALLQKKVVKIAPHIVDTILLLSAIGLVILLGQYPVTHHWLTAKVIALVLYIVFGMFTLKKAKNNAQRSVFFGLAVSSFLYILFVAKSHNALFFL